MHPTATPSSVPAAVSARPARGAAPARSGIPITEAAKALGIPRSAFVALCEAHGVLELRYFDGRQRRRLLSAPALAAGLGHNANLHSFQRNKADHRRSWPFAVFYRDQLGELAECLDWEGIQSAAALLPTREGRRAYLMTRHPYLLDQDIATLTGYSRQAIQKARAGQSLTSGEMVARADDGRGMAVAASS